MNPANKVVVMFVFNIFKPDIRVLKEAKTLYAAGYDVTILAVKDQQSKGFEEIDNIKVIRVELDPIHYQILRRLKDFLPKVKQLIFPGDSAPDEKNDRPSATFAPVDNSPISQQSPASTTPEKISSDSSSTAQGPWPKKLARVIYKSFFRVLKQILFLFHKPLRILDFHIRCVEIVESLSPYIYHAHDFNTLPTAARLKSRLGGKLVYDSHELYPEISGLTKLERKIFSVLEKRFIQESNHIITVNESIAKELSQRYNVPLPSVVMNCPELYAELAPHDLFRETLGIDQAVPIVLYQGGFSPGRGIENLILAMHQVEGGALVLMGWGKIEADLKALVALEKLTERVYFLPPVSQAELLNWSSSADIGVIPYRAISLNNYYSCPNKLFEYICAGIVVAGSNFPEIKKIIETRELGATFDPENSSSIAETINRILASPERYQTMRKNAQQARTHLNWESQEKELMTVYQNL